MASGKVRTMEQQQVELEHVLLELLDEEVTGAPANGKGPAKK